MIFIENTHNTNRVDIILGASEAEELLDVGPKLSISSLSLMFQLYRSEHNGSELIGCSVSRAYLRNSIQRINRETKPSLHHHQTPHGSPHYIEFGDTNRHDILERLAINIIGFLSTTEPPTASTGTSFKP